VLATANYPTLLQEHRVQRECPRRCDRTGGHRRSQNTTRSLYAVLSRTGNRKTGGGLSARSVLYVHSILHRALADATRKGLVTRNVADAASPPTAKAAKAPKMSWWTPEELSRFLGLMEAEDLFPFYQLAAMSGMRRGECCGLRWADLDLDAGRVNVRQQYVVADHVAYFAPRTKSDHGRRTIDLDGKTTAILRAHRAQQVAGRLAAGAGYQDHDLVFCHPDGQPLHPEAVSKTFERRVRHSGLPYIRLHDLRHTHAAHLIAAGQDALVIAKRMGHASVSFTYDKYGHLMAKADSDAATTVAALVDGGIV
jgi:integrase